MHMRHFIPLTYLISLSSAVVDDHVDQHAQSYSTTPCGPGPGRRLWARMEPDDRQQGQRQGKALSRRPFNSGRNLNSKRKRQPTALQVAAEVERPKISGESSDPSISSVSGEASTPRRSRAVQPRLRKSDRLEDERIPAQKGGAGLPKQVSPAQAVPAQREGAGLPKQGPPAQAPPAQRALAQRILPPARIAPVNDNPGHLSRVAGTRRKAWSAQQAPAQPLADDYGPGYPPPLKGDTVIPHSQPGLLPSIWSGTSLRYDPYVNPVPRYFENNVQRNQFRGDSPPPRRHDSLLRSQGEFYKGKYSGRWGHMSTPALPSTSKGNRARIWHRGPSRIGTNTHYLTRASSIIRDDDPVKRVVVTSSQKSIDTSMRTYTKGEHLSEFAGQHIKAVGVVKDGGGTISMSGGGQQRDLDEPGERGEILLSDPDAILKTTAKGDTSVIVAASTKPFGAERGWEGRWHYPPTYW